MRVEIAAICKAEDVEGLTLTQSDRAYIETLGSVKRRCEVASWRALLRGMLGDLSNQNINYTSVGAPYIEGTPIYIGVSHSSHFVAVIASEDGTCAIDIEDYSRDFQRVAHKYTSSEEVALFGGADLALATIWAAKETLYKVSGSEGMDLKDDIIITKVNPNTLLGRVLGSEYELRYYTHQGHIVVHTL